MAVKKYWKISREKILNLSRVAEGHEWPKAMSDTITTSDIFQYFLTAMHDSHSLILNMIQQFEKNHFECMI